MKVQRVSFELETPASPEALWEVLEDYQTWSEWGPWQTSEVERPGDDTPAGVGAIRRLTIGRRVLREETTRYDPHELTALACQRQLDAIDPRGGQPMFRSLGHLTVRRRKLVLVVTGLFVGLAAVAGSGVFGALKGGGFDDPHAESTRARQLLD